MIPIGESRELVRASGLPESTLIVVGTDHRLAAPEPLEAMLEAVERAAAQTRGRRGSASGGMMHEP